MIHSSLTAFGTVEGGARTLVEAIDEVIGPEGLLAMPAYSITTTMKDHLDQNPVFDMRTTASHMGAVTEYFRKMPGVYRSLHPTHSVCARGAGAKQLVARHEYCKTPFSPGSPFYKMIEDNFLMLLFGVSLARLTIYHVYEEMVAGDLPFRLYLDEPYHVSCIKKDGSEVRVSVLVHDPASIMERIDNNRKKQEILYSALKNRDALKEKRVGSGTIMAVRAKEVIADLPAVYRRNPDA